MRNLFLASMFCLVLCGVSYGQKDTGEKRDRSAEDRPPREYCPVEKDKDGEKPNIEKGTDCRPPKETIYNPSKDNIY